jgi:hypothetical protein
MLTVIDAAQVRAAKPWPRLMHGIGRCRLL